MWAERGATAGPQAPVHWTDAARRPDNYDWATLLRRVFQVDVTVCASCGGPAKLISAITDPAVIRKILKHLGLPAEPPRIGQGRGPPDRQLELLGVVDDEVA